MDPQDHLMQARPPRHLSRRVRTILIVDVAESVKMIARDEEGTVRRWLDLVQAVAADVLSSIGGRIVKSLGDGMLIEFPDTRSAVSAAFSIQALSQKRNEHLSQGQQILLRMAIEVGEVIVGDSDVYGHSVNVAARLMTTLAGPGEIVISANARDQLTATLDADIEDLGDCYLKSLETPVRAYRVGPPGPSPLVSPLAQQGRFMPAIAVIPFAARMVSAEHHVI